MSASLARVTIGLPFFRNRETLAHAIRSVFAQTWTDWRLILVDDGSDDGSLRIARSVRDPRVTVVSDGKNRGLAFRLNQIVSLATGELVARMDADDVMHPERLAKQFDFLRANPSVDVVGTGLFSLDAFGRIRGVMRPIEARPRPRDVLTKGPVAHATILGRRSWFAANPYDPRYTRAEDLDLWCRTYATSRFESLGALLYFYRQSPGAETLRKYVVSRRDGRRLVRIHGPRLAGRWFAARANALSLAKECVFRVATLAGLQEQLLARRSRRATPMEHAEALAALGLVRATPVPGLAE